VPGRTHDIGLIGDDHFARRRIEDLGLSSARWRLSIIGS
jgi:hypothetical protein